MRKFLTSLLAVCLLCMMVLPYTVHADVLVELDDSFWGKHQNECDYLFRQYTVNAPEGYATVWESPVSSKQVQVLPNGTEISSSWHYTDDNGEVWCVLPSGEYHNGKDGVTGWVKTSECLVTPDYISFQEAYEQEFVEYDPAYDNAFEGLDTVTLWAYPCSGRVIADRIDANWFQDNMTPPYDFYPCWRDLEGRMWAFIGYCYGIRNTWICLDDPAGTQLAVSDDTGTQSGEEIQPSEDILRQDAVIYPPAEELPKVRGGVTGMVVAGVLGVVGVTAFLIWFLFARGKKKG